MGTFAMIRNGTTCFADPGDFIPRRRSGREMIGIRVVRADHGHPRRGTTDAGR